MMIRSLDSIAIISQANMSTRWLHQFILVIRAEALPTSNVYRPLPKAIVFSGDPARKKVYLAAYRIRGSGQSVGGLKVCKKYLSVLQGTAEQILQRPASGSLRPAVSSQNNETRS